MNKIKTTSLGLNEKRFSPYLSKLKYNHKYWEVNAKKYKTNHSVSWGDINIINMEIKNILEFLKAGDLVLDVGCSNGYSTFEIASKKKIKIHAIDYSEQSILYAKKAQKSKDKKNQINFYHANVLDIPEDNGSFDVVYTIRVIINLLSWELQKKAILEIHRVLKPGGLYLMSEAFQGSLTNINKLRSLADLPPLVMHDFNLYLNEKRLERFIEKYFEIIEIRRFSSIYYVASRFMRYLTINKGAKDSFQNDFNNLFKKYKETNQSGDFGVQKLYILKKK